MSTTGKYLYAPTDPVQKLQSYVASDECVGFGNGSGAGTGVYPISSPGQGRGCGSGPSGGDSTGRGSAPARFNSELFITVLIE